MDGFDAGAIFTEDGSFTDAGRQAMVSAAGEGHEETTLFDDVKGFSGLCKRFADTKTSHDKKLENVIQKPADDATEEVKTAYRNQLAEASGAPKDASGYEFFKAEKLPEGMERSQQMEDDVRAIFHKHGASAALVKDMSEYFENAQIGAFNGLVESDKKVAAEKADAEQKLFDEGCTALKTEWPGDDLAKNARISLAAINQFATDELKKGLAAANMYENATDLTKWKEAGVKLETLRIFHNVGLKTLDAETLGGKPGATAGAKNSPYARTKKQLGET